MTKNIADRLELIHIQTLYELLQSPKHNTTITLFQAAEALYAQEVRQHPTAEVTARVELAGFAMSLFRTDEMRARYDETLRQMSLQQLLKDITESVKRSKIKEVHPRQVLYYLKIAAEAGWSEEEALDKLKEHGRIHQWFITMPSRQQSAASSTLLLGSTSSLPPQSHSEFAYQPQQHIMSGSVWRRVKASTLLLVQCICLAALARANFNLMQPLILWLTWGNQTRLGILALSIKNARQFAQTFLASYTPTVPLHASISVISFLLIVIINSISIALILTPSIPIIFILIGFVSGSYIGLKNLGKTLVMAHMKVNKTTPAVQKCYAFDRGWHIEKLIAENLSVTFRNLNLRWSNTADILTDWRWRRNRLIV